MGNESVLRNKRDLKWEKMLPELGNDSPVYSILRVDPLTDAMTLLIEFPSQPAGISTCQEESCMKLGFLPERRPSSFWNPAGRWIGCTVPLRQMIWVLRRRHLERQDRL